MTRSSPSPPASRSNERPSASSRLLRRAPTETPWVWANSVQNLALVRGRNFELFAVFGDGTACQLEPFTLQHRDNLRIAQRLARILVLDDLADALLDRHRRDTLAVRAADAAVEEVLHLEHALGRVHVLVRDDAADRRLVHADVVGHVAQHQRPQVLDAVVQEVPLEVDDALRNLEDRL